MTEPTKRPWATIPELPNDIYQKIPDGYAYLGEFYEGEDNIGSAAANAALVVRAVNIYDEAKEAFECVEYALTHPGSKQQFALMVVQHMLEKMK